MNIDTSAVIPISLINQNIAHIVDQNGSAVVMDNDTPHYVIYKFNQSDPLQASSDNRSPTSPGERIQQHDHTSAIVPFTKDAHAILNAILKTVIDALKVQNDVKKEFKSFYETLANGDVEKARQILQELSEVLGENDPEVVGASTTLALETME